ncbi:hypothetical protein Tco_1244620 [Tanacetum coccineum]
MVDSQLVEEEVRGLEPGDVGTKTQKGLTEPVSQTQTTPYPSSAFVKENIDVLRTMIKEHDHQTKTTPRKLIYADSKRETPDELMAISFFDRLSLESSGTSDTQGQGGWRTGVELRKEPEGRNPKPEEEGPNCSDTKCEEGSEDTCEDLNSPCKGPKPTPFTPRITRFKYHWRAKLPRNIRVYEGNKDPEDHLSIFSAATKQEKWLMPISCKMFRQTLSEAARNWFDDLDPRSVNSFEELSQKFLEEFSQQKRYAKRPHRDSRH